MAKTRNAYIILVSKCLGKQLLGRERRWKGNRDESYRSCERKRWMNWLRIMPNDRGNYWLRARGSKHFSMWHAIK
jgi:hypothetical protein